MYPVPELQKILLALIHSFFIGFVGFYLYFWGLKHMEVGKITLLTFSEVIFGTFFGYVFLTQIPSLYTYLGISCILMSGIILSLKNKKTHQQ